MIKFQEISYLEQFCLVEDRLAPEPPPPAGAVLVSHQFPEMMHLQTHFSGYFKPRSDIFSSFLDSKNSSFTCTSQQESVFFSF